MQILALVTDAFGGHGGIAKFNRDLLSALCRTSHVEQVTALPRLMPELPGELPAKLRYITTGLGGKLRYTLAVLKSSLANRHASVILCGHINLLPLAFLARLLTSGRPRRANPDARKPVQIVLIIHGIDAWQPTRSWLVNRLARKTDAVVAVSEFTRKKFWDWAQPARAQSFILPNCVELAQFLPGPKSALLLKRYALESQTVLLTVARLSAAERYKGIDEVLEILPTLAAEIPRLAYLIVGDGDDRSHLVAKSKSLGLRVSEFRCPAPEGEIPKSDHGPSASVAQPSTLNPQPPLVVFSGHIPESEKVDHYRLADAFVMPGRGEGFGIVYLEAMACGVPVIASKLDASGEIIAALQVGAAVDARNPGELRGAILDALRGAKSGVPARLAEFSSTRFAERCGAMLAGLGLRDDPKGTETAMVSA